MKISSNVPSFITTELNLHKARKKFKIPKQCENKRERKKEKLRIQNNRSQDRADAIKNVYCCINVLQQK
jgi:hypothetical protein